MRASSARPNRTRPHSPSARQPEFDIVAGSLGVGSYKRLIEGRERGQPGGSWIFGAS